MTREKNVSKFLLTGVSFAFLVGFFQANDAHSEGKKKPVLLACNVNGQARIIQKPVLVTLCYSGLVENEYCSNGQTARDAFAACMAAFPRSIAIPTLPSSAGCPIVGHNQYMWEKNRLCMSYPFEN